MPRSVSPPAGGDVRSLNTPLLFFGAYPFRNNEILRDVQPGTGHAVQLYKGQMPVMYGVRKELERLETVHPVKGQDVLSWGISQMGFESVPDEFTGRCAKPCVS